VLRYLLLQIEAGMVCSNYDFHGEYIRLSEIRQAACGQRPAWRSGARRR
jgi:hypothetical protein